MNKRINEKKRKNEIMKIKSFFNLACVYVIKSLKRIIIKI